MTKADEELAYIVAAAIHKHRRNTTSGVIDGRRWTEVRHITHGDVLAAKRIIKLIDKRRAKQ